MRILILLLLSVLNYSSFAQIKSKNHNIINSNNEPITGIYRIQLKECYDKEGELYYSTFFEGVITIDETGNNISANTIRTNKPYFGITKSGTTYKISDIPYLTKNEGSFEEDLFKNSEIKLKLWSTAKDYSGYYTIYTLHRITDKKELYKSIKQGSGFFINPDGYIVTNFHVIANAELISAFISEKEYDCTIIFKNEIDDIAVIRVKDTSLRFSPISFSSKDFEVGDEVIALGYPLSSTMGKELKMSSGIVNSIKGFQDDARYFQFSASIEPGNSGGPILNKSGDLIGLITAKYTSAINAGYALSLKNIMKNIPNTIKYKKERTSKTISNSIIYLNHKSSIVLIKSYSL